MVSDKLSSRPSLNTVLQEGVLKGSVLFACLQWVFQDSHLIPIPTTEDITSLAPSLQSAAVSLDKEIKKDTLSHMLNNRPDVDALQQSGILSPRGTTEGLSPALASAAVALQHSMNSASLSRQLKERPSKEKLENEGLFSPAMA